MKNQGLRSGWYLYGRCGLVDSDETASIAGTMVDRLPARPRNRPHRRPNREENPLHRAAEGKVPGADHAAVTKGLDPTVPMKDSGVEWIGEVPAHWEVGAC